jgi:multidrug resistance efflux pump
MTRPPLRWTAAACLQATLLATAQAQLLEDIELRREGKDAVAQVRFVTPVQFQRTVSTQNGTLLQIFYSVLPTGERLNQITSERRLSGIPGLPSLLVTDEDAGRDGVHRMLLLRFSEATRYRVRAGRDQRGLEIVLDGRGSAISALTPAPSPVAATTAAAVAAAAAEPVPAQSAGGYAIVLQSSSAPGQPLAASIPAEFQDKAVYTSQRVANGKNLYEVSLGDFPTLPAAEHARSRLQFRFPAAVIVALRAAPPAPAPAPAPASKLIPTKRSTLLWMLGVLIIGILVILWAWRIGPFATSVQQTDNSYVKGKTTILSSQINGYVKDVLVKDFDHVKKGQVLMHIDATTYDQKVAQAASGVEQAKNTLANQTQSIAQKQADIVAAQAKVEQVRAQYELSLAQLRRYQQLGNSGAASKSEQDKAAADAENNLAALKQAEANVLVAKEALKTAQVAEAGLEAQVSSAKAQLDQAQTTKDYSVIVAPMDGQLGEVNPRVGQYVAAGSQLLYLIPQQTWVIANFKETQIANMRIGQKAWFTVDAMKHKKFTGHVEQISPAAGSEFSVLKPDNATGNFTKVVQRIAVRITIDPNQEGIEHLRPGMSVITSVDTSS